MRRGGRDVRGDPSLQQDGEGADILALLRPVLLVWCTSVNFRVANVLAYQIREPKWTEIELDSAGG